MILKSTFFFFFLKSTIGILYKIWLLPFEKKIDFDVGATVYLKFLKLLLKNWLFKIKKPVFFSFFLKCHVIDS